MFKLMFPFAHAFVVVDAVAKIESGTVTSATGQKTQGNVKYY